MSNTFLSVRQIDDQVAKVLNAPYKRITDGQGILHVFMTKRDYLTYLEERDLELMARER